MLREGWSLIGYKQSGPEAALFVSDVKVVELDTAPLIALSRITRE